MNIGVGKINCHIRILAEIFQGIGRARGATRMHKNSWTFLILFPNLDHFLHDTVIIDFLVEIHLAQNFFYINHHFLLFLSLFYHIGSLSSNLQGNNYVSTVKKEEKSFLFLLFKLLANDYIMPPIMLGSMAGAGLAGSG